jgi:hypothetical protein
MEKFIVELLNEKFYLTCLDKNDAYPIIIKLLGSHLYQNYSITQEEGDKISILAFLSEEQRQYIVDKSSCCLEYCCITIDTAVPALACSGMLNIITSLFAKHNISIMCTSTFNRNYIYFPTEERQKVVDMFNQNPEYELSNN